MLQGQARPQSAHLGLRLRQRYPGAQASDDGEESEVARLRIRAVGEGDPQVDISGEVEARRHHADDVVDLAVEHQRTADGIGRAAETALPEAMAEDHRRLPARGILGGGERPAQRRADAQHLEQIGGDQPNPQPLRRAARQAGLPAVAGRHPRERPVLAPVEEVGYRDRPRRARLLQGHLGEADQAAGIGKGQGAQKDRMDEAGGRGVGAHSQRQSGDHDQAEQRAPRQGPRTEAQCLPETRHL